MRGQAAASGCSTLERCGAGERSDVSLKLAVGNLPFGKGAAAKRRNLVGDETVTKDQDFGAALADPGSEFYVLGGELARLLRRDFDEVAFIIHLNLQERLPNRALDEYRDSATLGASRFTPESTQFAVQQNYDVLHARAPVREKFILPDDVCTAFARRFCKLA